MENPKYILVMRQIASDYDGISHELFQIANNLERMDQFNPQQKLFSLVRNAEVSTVSLRNLTARTVRDDTAHFYGEVADLLGIRIDETHDWLKITVPAILPKRNQRDNQAFMTRPLRYALLDFLKENPMERFGSCAICIVHNYDEALGKRRIRDYRKKEDEVAKERRTKAEAEERAFCEEQNRLSEQAVQEAIRTIKDGGVLQNQTVKFYRSRYRCNAFSIVNYLMRKYGVNVPLRTQGWINEKLTSVTIENGKCEHLRYMRAKGAQCSQRFFDCMSELIHNVCAETEG